MHPQRRRDVHGENESKLKGLKADTRQVFKAKDTVELHEMAPLRVTKESLLDSSFFKSDCQAPKEFELRIGAQVMLLKNEVPQSEASGGGGNSKERQSQRPRLVNGSRGVVIGWDWARPPQVKSDNRAHEHGTCGCGNAAARDCPHVRCGDCCRAAADCCARHAVLAASEAASVDAPSFSGGAVPEWEERGGHMLKMMGWSEGQGLGRHGDGITAPIPALGKVGRGGLGYEDEYLVEPPEMPSGPVPADVERGPDGEPLLYPVVRFKCKDGVTRVKLIRPVEFERHLYLKGTLTRLQVRSRVKLGIKKMRTWLLLTFTLNYSAGAARARVGANCAQVAGRHD
jgi:hypothetical protein